MKNKLLKIKILTIISCIGWLCGCSKPNQTIETNDILAESYYSVIITNNTIINNTNAPTRDILHEIANSYFRIGQQAALIAISRREEVERELHRKYPDGSTNSVDFEIMSNYLRCIDDPRIFQVVWELNGSMLGIDTNNWLRVYDGTNGFVERDWTVLK